MWRLTERMVRSTLVTAWRLAISPTSTSPFLLNATTDGVVRPPSAFAMMVGSPPSRTATAELVVPRSIPTARAMVTLLWCWVSGGSGGLCAPAAHTAAPDAGCQNQTPQSCVHLTQLRACGECSPPRRKVAAFSARDHHRCRARTSPPRPADRAPDPRLWGHRIRQEHGRGEARGAERPPAAPRRRADVAARLG